MYLQVLVALCLVVVGSQSIGNNVYTIPAAKIEAFRPRGLRVSIPDYPGIRLFAFHGVVNRNLNGLEAGDMSQDILTKTDGRWVFEDKRVKINYNDVLNYWVFVIIDNLGYRLDNQHFTFTSFQEAPPGFITGDIPVRKTTIAPNYPEESNNAGTAPGYDCTCRPKATAPPPPCLVSFINSPEDALAPAIVPPTTTTTTTTTTTPRPPAAPVELQPLKEILVNLSNENEEFRNRVQVLSDLNNLIINKLEKLGDENMKKLVMAGKISQTDAPFPFVVAVLKEKLGLMNSKILKSAERNDDGSITFELNTVSDKLNVLLLANQKLKSSKITIKDVDTIKLADRVNNENSDKDKIFFDSKSDDMIMLS